MQPVIRKSPDDAKWQPWFFLASAILVLAVGLMFTVLVASACDDGDPEEADPDSTPTPTADVTETATEQGSSPGATNTPTATEAPATPTPAPTEEPTSEEGDGGDDGGGGDGGGGFVDNSPEVPCTIGAPLSQNTRVARDCVISPLVNVEGFFLNDQAAAAYEDMKAAAAADGITLYIVSAYRDYETQMQLYLAEVAIYGPDQNTSAKPGHSEHQLGTTVDLNELSESFGDSPEGIWLQQNAGSYGFQMSYPPGGSTGYAYEPWHWRFWGR